MRKQYYEVLIKPLSGSKQSTKELAFGIFNQDQTLAIMRAVDASYTKEDLILDTVKCAGIYDEKEDYCEQSS